MRTIMTVLLALFSSAALAQSEPVLPVYQWTQDSVELKRFADADVVLLTLAPATKVELLATEGALTRVRRGTDFGWLPTAGLTDADPSVPSPAP